MWRAILSAFLIVLLAELGDKTQLSTFLLAARHRSPWPVFLGAAAALVTASLVAALLGGALGRVIPERVLRLLAGSAFIVLGGLLLAGKI
ncbi:MAG: TMEM165/GDT1 family protein [Bacillota bacterium]|nr:TMEM165/GDT1 family protein [Bacillota bacterium]